MNSFPTIPAPALLGLTIGLQLALTGCAAVEEELDPDDEEEVVGTTEQPVLSACSVWAWRPEKMFGHAASGEISYGGSYTCSRMLDLGLTIQLQRRRANGTWAVVAEQGGSPLVTISGQGAAVTPCVKDGVYRSRARLKNAANGKVETSVSPPITFDIFVCRTTY